MWWVIDFSISLADFYDPIGALFSFTQFDISGGILLYSAVHIRMLWNLRGPRPLCAHKHQNIVQLLIRLVLTRKK